MMVPLKNLFMNEFHSYINDFNNSMPLFKVPKDIFKLVDSGNTIRLYPNGSKMYAKLEQAELKVPFLDQIKKNIEKMIPDTDNKTVDHSIKI